MHAALVTLTIDPDQAAAAASALTNSILPAVRAAPGFVAGYWLEPDEGRGFSIVFFESEEQARQSITPGEQLGSSRSIHRQRQAKAGGGEPPLTPVFCCARGRAMTNHQAMTDPGVGSNVRPRRSLCRATANPTANERLPYNKLCPALQMALPLGILSRRYHPADKKLKKHHDPGSCDSIVPGRSQSEQ